MQIDVGASISALLYEHPAVTIPGLGALVGVYKPAAINQLEGKIVPPSRQISFNKNLLIDDGLLVKHLREKYQLSYGEAMREVDTYAKQVKDSIERREIVTFPQVGRLYKDYEQNFQFLPEETNFNIESYGLPTLASYPVARTTQEKIQAATAKKEAPVKLQKKNWLQRNLLLVSSIGAFVVAGGVYLLLQHPKEMTVVEEEMPSIPTSRYNVGPTEDEEATNADLRNDIDADDSDSEAATLKPGTKSAIITLGTFGNKENVDRLIKKIYEAGYEPYTEKVGKNTRVGIQMPYERTAELTRAKETISKEFNTKAAIYKK